VETNWSELKMSKKPEFESKVISGGRITIPYDIRLIHNINPGDRVKVTLSKVEEF
jgi:bifunctional DNA-binding transcriptional regulator/antitoxin component of YhaV-PrlF toxin-antitoxin module